MSIKTIIKKCMVIGDCMNKFEVLRDVGGIEGLCLIEPIMFKDTRGFFMETYNRQEFYEHGLKLDFVQDNEVHSKKGVLRGMHVNICHPQGKLIRVSYGRIFDVVVDLRKNSRTYQKWFGIVLSKDNLKQLYIPKGMGHGYLALEDSVVHFKVTTHYIPNDEIGFAWNSKSLGIEWPIFGMIPILSKTDENSKEFSELDL